MLLPSGEYFSAFSSRMLTSWRMDFSSASMESIREKEQMVATCCVSPLDSKISPESVQKQIRGIFHYRASPNMDLVA